MSTKSVHKRLKNLHDRIKDQRRILPGDEAELRAILEQTLLKPVAENSFQEFLAAQAGNDNQSLTPDQRFRLGLVEKTGSGSEAIH